MEGSEGWWILIYFQEQCTLIVPSETEGSSPPFAQGGFALGNVFHYRSWTEPCIKVYQLAKPATQKYSPFAGSGSYARPHRGEDA